MPATLPPVHRSTAAFIAPPSPARALAWHAFRAQFAPVGRGCYAAPHKIVKARMELGRPRVSPGAGVRPALPWLCPPIVKSCSDLRLAEILQQAPGIALRLGAGPAEHAGDLADALLTTQGPRARHGAPFDDPLLDSEMVIGERRDLRQMRDAQHLAR